MCGIGVRGETYAARALQPCHLLAHSLAPALSHLTAKSLLVSLPLHYVILEKDVAAYIYAAAPNWTDVPALVYVDMVFRRKPVYGYLREYVKERLVLTQQNHIVRKPEIAVLPFTDEPVELPVQVVDPPVDLSYLVRRAESGYLVLHVTPSPVRHPIQVPVDTKALLCAMVKIEKKEIGEYLGYLLSKGESLQMTVDELVNEIERLPVPYLLGNLVFHQLLLNVLEIVMGVKLHKIQGAVRIGVKAVVQHFYEIVRAPTLDT